ncbi:MAG: stage 0 sporulation family protein [Nitrospirae bacterium]|nr:MAG: stage 0 sporulation family protein [Nitrospirota bacterium]
MSSTATEYPEILEDEGPYPQWVTVVGVKVRDLGEVKKARTDDVTLEIGDYVLLQLDGDITFGKVYTKPHPHPFIPPMRVMRAVLRKATPEDEATIAYHQQLAQAGMAYCRERALALGLQMKLVEVYGSFQRRVLTFSYTADSRVDFRQLVKDLAKHFGCRIEMRQISTREEARRLSGVDTCGLVLCCATFLTDFKPINVRASRGEVHQSVESYRIGLCGRLKCCLLFEQDEWLASNRQSPSSLIHLDRTSSLSE